MPNKVLDAGFNRDDIPKEEFPNSLSVSDLVELTLSRLLGWDDSNKQFRKIQVDTDGRVLISTAQLNTDTATNSQITADTTPQAALSANPSRRYWAIENIGSEDLYFRLGTDFVLGTAFRIPPDGVYSDDIYTGAIYVATSVNTTDVRIIEV